MLPNLSLSELNQLRRNHEQIWPDDLIQDIGDEYPQVCQERMTYDALIAQKISKRSEQNTPLEEEQTEYPASVIKALPTLVVPGWQNIKIKGTKNWADFENLLLFYTIGKLAVPQSQQIVQQQEKDKSELRKAIESFLPLKNQKFLPAEKRVAVSTTYLSFAKDYIDATLENNDSRLYELDREITDAEDNNYFNGQKLRKSQTIALKVIKKLKERYA